MLLGVHPSLVWGLPLAFFGIILFLIAKTVIIDPPEVTIDCPRKKNGQSPEDLRKNYTGEAQSTEKIFDFYKLYFDHYVGTRAERNDWSKFFITLLFVQTLVGVLTAILGVQKVITLPGFTQGLMIVVVFVAAIISLTWFAKLQYMTNLISAEETVIKDMEKALSLPFYGVNREFCAFFEEEDQIGTRKTTSHYIQLRFWVSINYWLLPLILFFVFVGIGIVLLGSVSIKIL